MTSRDAEDKAGREHFDSQMKLENLPNNDKIHHQLSQNHCTLLYSLSCIKERGLIKRGTYFKFMPEKESLLEGS